MEKSPQGESAESLSAELVQIWNLMPKLSSEVSPDDFDDLMQKAKITESFKRYIKFEFEEYREHFSTNIDFMKPDEFRDPILALQGNKGGIFDQSEAEEIEGRFLDIYRDLQYEYHFFPTHQENGEDDMVYLRRDLANRRANEDLLYMEGVMIGRRYLKHHLGSAETAMQYERSGIIVPLLPWLPIEINEWVKEFDDLHKPAS